LLVGHDLDPQSEQQVRRHLAECPQCREHWRGLNAGAAALQQVTTARVPRQSLWPAVRAQLPTKRVALGQGTWAGWFPVLALTAACIGIMVSSSHTPVFDFDGQPTPVQMVVGPPPRPAGGQSSLVQPVGEVEMFLIAPGWTGEAAPPQAGWSNGPWGNAPWSPTDAPFVKEHSPRSF
jgi:anti-sigma factor RsiW